MAGTEVATSAVVLFLGNVCCIKKKTEHKEVADEREELNKKAMTAEGDKVDSIEVEHFLKDEKNGEVVTNPETCVWMWREWTTRSLGRESKDSALLFISEIGLA